jgi:hypothetical protein
VKSMVSVPGEDCICCQYVIPGIKGCQ